MSGTQTEKALTIVMVAAATILMTLILATSDGDASASKWKMASLDGKSNDVLVEELIAPPVDEIRVRVAPS